MLSSHALPPHDPSLASMDSETVRLKALALLSYFQRVVHPIAIKPIGHDTFADYLFGSAQVLHIGGHYVLVTASHNINESDGRQHNIGLTKGHDFRHGDIYWLTGKRHQGWGTKAVIQEEEDGPEKTCDVDVAIIEMTKEEVEEFGFEPVGLDQVAARRLLHGEFTIIVGFPGVLYDTAQFNEGIVTAKYLSFATIGVDTAEWLPEWSPHLHQAVFYPKDEILKFEYDRTVSQVLPRPHGISGCAMWSVPEAPDAVFSFKNAYLVGVQNEYHGVPQLLRGTNIYAILSLIADIFPGTRTLIEARGLVLPGSHYEKVG